MSDVISNHDELALIADRLALINDPIDPPTGLADRTIDYCLMLAPVAGPLDLIDGEIEFPEGLAERTTQFVLSADAVPSSLAKQKHRDEPILLGKRRADLIVAAMIAFVVVGLSITAVQKLRADASRAACQNNLRELHVALSDYADHHHGLYPVGNQAGDFADELKKSGYSSQANVVTCPADSSIRTIGYSYSLGFKSSNGNIVAFRRPDPILGNEDLMPLVADFPAKTVAPAGGPFSPHGPGQNVLYAGGFVRYTTSALVGVNGDDIYRNQAGVVAAGLTRADACLGRPTDQP